MYCENSMADLIECYAEIIMVCIGEYKQTDLKRSRAVRWVFEMN